MDQRPDTDNPIGHAGPTPPPLALAELVERCMGDAGIAILVLDKFEKQLMADIRAIQAHLAGQAAGEIASTAHALKGAAGAAAASGLRDLAATIEGLARQERIESIATQLSSLRNEVERCLAYLPVARGALKRGSPGGTEAGG